MMRTTKKATKLSASALAAFTSAITGLEQANVLLDQSIDSHRLAKDRALVRATVEATAAGEAMRAKADNQTVIAKLRGLLG